MKRKIKQQTNAYYKNRNYFNIFLQRINEGGLFFALKKMWEFILDLFIMHFLFLKQKRYFSFNGKRLPYLYHPYNKAWKNSRAVEVPITLDYISNYKGNRILEFGNVINHYKKFEHDVLDKYESVGGIINKDVINFKPKNKYDIIISISTLEHVGIDDFPKDSSKAIGALLNLKDNCLKSDGAMKIIIPINYNPSLTEIINKNRLSNEFKISYMKRINKKKNLWIESNFKDTKSLEHLEGLIILDLKSNKRHIR